MKRLLIGLTCLLICSTAWGESSRINNPKYLKFYAPMNGNFTNYISGVSGTANGSTAFLPFIDGHYMYDQDGTNDSIQWANSDCCPFGTEDFSICFWIKAESTAGYILTKNSITGVSPAGQYAWGIYMSSSKLAFGRNSAAFTGTAALSANTWYFCTFTRQGNSANWYINGVLDNTNATFMQGYSFSNDFDMDTGKPDDFPGIIGDIRIYKGIALTADEQVEIMHQLKPNYASIPQPIDTLPDIAIGDTAYVMGAWLNKSSNLKDYSSFGHDGTNYGATLESVGASFDGVNDKIDFGNVGTVYGISMWINPATVDEEICMFDSGKYINLVSGVVTTTGLGMSPASKICVDEVETTTMVADKWQRLFVGRSGDAQNFEVGTDGTGFGNIKVKDVRVYSGLRNEYRVIEFQEGVPDSTLLCSVLDGTRDLSCYDRALRITNPITIGGYMEFDGTVDHTIETFDSVTHDIGTGDFTMCSWVYSEASSDAFMANGAYAPGVYNAANKLSYYWGGYNNFDTAFPLNKWVFVGIARRSGVIYGYINGVEETTTYVDTTSMANGVFTIGSSDNGADYANWDGKIKDTRFYKSGKSADWFKDYYNKTKANY